MNDPALPELDPRTARFRLLAEVGRAFAEAGLDWERVVGTIARSTAEALGGACVVRVPSPDAHALVPVAFHHHDEEALGLLTQALAPDSTDGGTLPARVFRTRQAERVAVAPPPDRVYEEHAQGTRMATYLASHPPGTLMCVPLLVRDGPALGTLEAYRDQGEAPFTDDDQFLLEELATRAALSIEHARLHRDAEAARAAAEAAVRERDELLAIVSHDLRGPLAVASMHAQVIAARAGDDEAGRAIHRSADVLLRVTDAMNRLVHELLDLATIEGRGLRLSLEVHDAAALVAAASETVSAALHGRRQELLSTIEPGLRVVCDRDRIVQALGNLLSNASKFGPEGQTIEVRVTSAAPHVRVTVVDRGPGIPVERLPRLFERFSRLGDDPGSIGLGLYITRRLVEAHGGQVSVDTAPGRGSAFWFTLPGGVRTP
jgi:signal transduction histidine kinase